MPTVEQIRAARALLDWSQSDLADRAGLSQTGIARIENGTNQPNSQTLSKIVAAFEKADIEFMGLSGLRKKTGEIKTFRGLEGLKTFMDDVYEIARDQGGEFFFHNIRPENWIKWLGQEWWTSHVNRMTKVKDNCTIKITVPEDNFSFISKEYGTYKWFPKDLIINENKSIYIYGHKIAFLNFEPDNVEITVLNNREFSEGVRILLMIAWSNACHDPIN
jgi:transcriptional regulator with XRE-family HTH domain